MGQCLTGVQKFWGLACLLWLISFLIAGTNNFHRSSAESALVIMFIGGFPMMLFLILFTSSKLLDSQSDRSRDVEPLQIITQSTISAREIAPEPREQPHTDLVYNMNIDSPITYMYQKDGRAEGNDCAVCLGYLQQGELVARLRSCSHLFHEKCIDPWLRLHNTCPICRSRVDQKRLKNPWSEILPQLQNLQTF